MKIIPRNFSLVRSTLLSAAISTTAAVTLVLPGVSRTVSEKSANATFENSPKAVLDEAWQIVNREYVDANFNQVDWQVIRQELLSQNYTSHDEAYLALKNALERLGDPYTRFMNPKQFEALTNQTSGELSGVGMQLEQDEATQVITVVKPMENSPAIRAGIQPRDQILEIDGKSTTGMTVGQAAEMIRGAVGTQVTLRISRPGTDPFDLTLTRARIELEAVRYSLKEEGQTRVGYIRLQEFSAHAGEQMERAIQELQRQQAEGFVLDLRGNPGGLLRISIDIARMWLNDGAIVSTVDRNGESQEMRATRTSITDKPLVVLVDGDSASASEILAGALKDNQRATIMGTQTFGKALVQSVHALGDGSGLAVTIAHYYTPNGTDISKKGVTPDIPIELSEGEKRNLATQPNLLATEQDPYYSRAINLLQTAISARPVAAH